MDEGECLEDHGVPGGRNFLLCHDNCWLSEDNMFPDHRFIQSCASTSISSSIIYSLLPSYSTKLDLPVAKKFGNEIAATQDRDEIDHGKKNKSALWFSFESPSARKEIFSSEQSKPEYEEENYPSTSKTLSIKQSTDSENGKDDYPKVNPVLDKFDKESHMSTVDVTFPKKHKGKPEYHKEDKQGEEIQLFHDIDIFSWASNLCSSAVRTNLKESMYLEECHLSIDNDQEQISSAKHRQNLDHYKENLCSKENYLSSTGVTSASKTEKAPPYGQETNRSKFIHMHGGKYSDEGKEIMLFSDNNCSSSEADASARPEANTWTEISTKGKMMEKAIVYSDELLISRERHSVNCDSRRFPCDFCDKQFKHHRNLKTHLKIHCQVKESTCRRCKNKFTQNISKRKFICGTCSKSDDQMSFHCKSCTKSFKRRLSLKVHESTMHATNLFRCDVCSKTFGHKTPFHSHMKRHYGVKSFSCEVCGKRFLTKYELKQHLHTHDDARNFTCESCGKTFKQKSGFYHHKKDC